jgi:hypothetical protein
LSKRPKVARENEEANEGIDIRDFHPPGYRHDPPCRFTLSHLANENASYGGDLKSA